MFEEAIKVPFIASMPGQIVQGAVNQDMVSQYDFLPTLLDFVGIEHPQAGSLLGMSFANALHQSEASGDDHIIVYDEYGPVRMIRNAQWKYIHRNRFGDNGVWAPQLGLEARRVARTFFKLIDF